METLVFQLFSKISLTFANLKELGDLFKHIKRLQIPVTSLARTLAPSFKILPGSLLMSAALWCQYLLKSYAYNLFLLIVNTFFSQFFTLHGCSIELMKAHHIYLKD